MSRESRAAIGHHLLVAVFLGAFAVGIVHFHQFSIDDAYITYRFAHQLLANGSLRWNPSESPVEGYTSFTAVLISAVLLSLRVDPLIGWKTLNVLLLLVLGYNLVRFWHRVLAAYAFLDRPILRVGLTALFVLNPLIFFHLMSGLETILFAVLLLSSWLQAARLALTLDSQAPWTMALTLLGLCLTRPDGVLWALAVAAGALVACRGPSRWVMGRALLIALLSPGLAYLGWRVSYFGDFFPNTFYVKTHPFGASPTLNVATLLPHWRLLAFTFTFAMPLAVLLATHRSYSRSRLGLSGFRALLTFPLIAVLLSLAYYSTVTPLMGFALRFGFPFLLVLCAYAVLFTTEILSGDSSRRMTRLFVALTLATYLAGSVLAAFRSYPVLATNNVTVDEYRKIGAVLERVADGCSGSLRLYHHNVGELMYMAPRWEAVDAIGLVDRHIARAGLTAAYVFGKEPDLLILPSLASEHVTTYRGEHRPDVSRLLIEHPSISDYSALGSLARLHFFIRVSTAARCPGALTLIRDELALRATAESRSASLMREG